MIDLAPYLVLDDKSNMYYDCLAFLEKAQKNNNPILIEDAKDLIKLTADTVQKTYHFPNGYGASVMGGKIFNPLNNGLPLYELAVCKKNQEGEWEMALDTPISNEILKGLTNDGYQLFLEQIFSLPKAKQ